MRNFAKCLLLIHQKYHENKHVQPHAPNIKLELAEKKGWSSIKANAVDAAVNAARDKAHIRDHIHERAHAEKEDSSSRENQQEKGLSKFLCCFWFCKIIVAASCAFVPVVGNPSAGQTLSRPASEVALRSRLASTLDGSTGQFRIIWSNRVRWS